MCYPGGSPVKKFIVFLSFLIMLSPISGFCQPREINILTDQGYWYPFSFAEEGQAKGLYIDMIEKAVMNLGYKPKFYPKPWKRCLSDAKNGKYDAIVGASYKLERAEYLIYPDDAKTAKNSLWRITQVEYVAITHSNSSYTFDGDVKSLPQPIRAPLGYSIVDDLKKAGVSVLEAPDIVDLALQLVKSGRGCFIAPPQNATGIMYDERFKGKFKIHPKPIKSKSYFMPFAIKNQKFNKEEILAIWNEIVRMREDQDYMKTLYDKYKGQNK